MRRVWWLAQVVVLLVPWSASVPRAATWAVVGAWAVVVAWTWVAGIDAQVAGAVVP